MSLSEENIEADADNKASSASLSKDLFAEEMEDYDNALDANGMLTLTEGCFFRLHPAGYGPD